MPGERRQREALAPIKPVFNVLETVINVVSLVVIGLILFVLGVSVVVWIISKLKLYVSPERRESRLDK